MQSLLCVCFISENQPVLPWNLPNHTELLRYSFFKPATGTVYSKAILNVPHKLIKSKFSWVLMCRLMQIKSHTLCRCRRPESVHIQTDRFNLCQNNVLFFFPWVFFRQRKGKRQVQKWRWSRGSRRKTIWTEHIVWLSGIQNGCFLHWWWVIFQAVE